MTDSSRTAAIARGLGALLVLLVLLGALPVALAREVGWPLPTAVPTFEQVSQAVNTGAIEDATIIKALAILLWLAWTNFAAAVLLEGLAVARARQARRRPLTETSQQLAGQLLASVSLAFSLVGRPAVALASPESAGLRLAVATALADQPAGTHDRVPVGPAVRSVGVTELGPPRSAQATADGEGTAYLVQRGDTLWDIAERFLGDGLRWREIRDANVGRPQPDGVSLRPDGEDLHVGWTLVISGPAGEGITEPLDRVIVAPGDTLWEVADERLGDPFRWHEVYDENAGRPQPDGGALTDPGLIRPGWILEIPDAQSSGAPDEAPAPVPEPADRAQPPERELSTLDSRSRESDDPEPSVPAGGLHGASAAGQAGRLPERGLVTDELPRPTEVVASEDEDGQSPFVITTGAATLAAGVVLTLDRIRRARRRRRETGTRIPLPQGEVALAECRLRAVADERVSRAVDLSLRELVQACGTSRLPPVTLVSHDDAEVRVHLVGRHDPPEGWLEGNDGDTWNRPLPSDVADLEQASGTPSRLPALVTLGTLDDGSVVLLNLAQPGCLHLDGDAEQAEELLLAWALELATTPRADALQILAHGLDRAPADLERLEAVDDPDELRGRLAGAPMAESSVPATVVLAAGAGADLASWVRVATEQRGDVVAVVAAPPPRPGAWSIQLDGGEAHLRPEGVTFTPLSLDGTGIPEAATLLDQAKHEEDRPVPIPPLDEESDLVVRDESPEPARPTITVRILGKVDVAGVGPFPANKTMELVVYLAMNRDGADADTLLEALWPGQAPKPARLYTEAWRARKVLGTAPDGAPCLPDAELGIYRLSEGVALDYEEFRTHVAKARQQPDDAAMHLRAALELVRGEPLSKTATEYAWAVHDSYRIAQEVADAAHDLAQLLLQAGRYDEASKAAEDGLKAEPGSELLIRDLMEIAAASGNGGRVHDLMTRLRRQVAEDGDANDADDYLHPETLATFERLTGGPERFSELQQERPSPDARRHGDQAAR